MADETVAQQPEITTTETVEKKEETPEIVEAETTAEEAEEETPAAEEPVTEETEEVKVEEQNGDVETSLKRKSISTDELEVKKKKVDETDTPAAAVQEAEA